MEGKPVLAGLLPETIRALIREIPGPAVPDFRARQIHRWIIRGARDFSEMSDLPETFRKELAGHFRLFSSSPDAVLEDPDGTIKTRILLEDGNRIEAVILRDGEGRKTACLSTQAGCGAACVFCKTGSLGFRRDLGAGEIIEEMLFLRQQCPEISHVVVMGMGEPLLNLGELRKALTFISGKEGLGISKRHITLSTVGITRGIRELADEGPEVRLAVSLTSARQGIREKLMPLARSNPLAVLKESLLYYQTKRKQRITLEAVLLRGINTSQEEAQAMAEFARGLNAVVNLIPWNPVEGLSLDGVPLAAPSAKETALFAAALEKRNLKVTLRMGKGRSVSGACGQLGELSGLSE